MLVKLLASLSIIPVIICCGDEIYLMDDHTKIADENIGISARIGVESAGADALLPYRFYIKGNKYVSGKNK